MPSEIRRIAAFLEIEINDQDWPNILEYSSFQWMKQNATKSVPLGGAFWDEGAKVFINKGMNGRWKDILSDAEVMEYESLAKQELGNECAEWLKNGNR
jgi:aryl sulfotransferase